MRANLTLSPTLLVWAFCLAPRAEAQPQVGATELARARTLLALSRAELSAKQFALLSRKLAAAESAYAELTTIARASQAAAAATEGGAAASARAASTGGRALLGGAAELLPLLVLLWPSTAHAPGVKQETPEIRAARKKVEESLEALAQAARQVEEQRAAVTARPGGGKPPGDPPCTLVGSGGPGQFKPAGPALLTCRYVCGDIEVELKDVRGTSVDDCEHPNVLKRAARRAAELRKLGGKR